MLLEVKNLSLEFALEGYTQPAQALRSVSLEVQKGESIGLVGESGSGKSLLSLTVMGLLPENASVSAGSILWKGENILQFPKEQRRHLRGRSLGMIFQDPMSALNPVLTLEAQMRLVLEAHEGHLTPQQTRDRTLELFGSVGIPDPASRLKAFPHELSGGQAQRVMIAMAISSQPELLIADEPTTALDVTIQAQVMTLLRKIQKEKHLSLIFISHDLALISQNTKRIYVLYAGEVVEAGPMQSLIQKPQHPYTEALLSCLPAQQSHDRMITIPGQVPSLKNRPQGCQFHPRCHKVMEICKTKVPPVVASTRCHLYG